MDALKVAALLLLAAGCAKKPVCEPRVLEVRRVAKLSVDGKLDELDWHQTPNTGALSAVVSNEIVSHTEVRALYDDRALYLGWYAADQDIGSKDLLVAELDGKAFEVRPGMPGVDTDGTLDDPKDDDEEWTAEQVVTWAQLGLKGPPPELKADFRRDDQPKGSQLRHQRWATDCGGVLRLK